MIGQVLIKVHACGVCRTDLHVVDGDLAVNGKPTEQKVRDYMKNLRDRLVEVFPDGHPNVKVREQAP